MKKTKLRNLSLGGLVLMFLLGVVLAFTGIFGGVFNTSTTASADTGDEITTYAASTPITSNFESAWNTAVTNSKTSGTQVAFTLGANWTAQSDGTYTTSFGSDGVGFDGGRITVPEDANILLDLNGHTINRALASETAIETGSVIYVNGGSLTVTDSATNGTITGGNTTSRGGGILVEESGSLTISGGSVSDNTALNGGGIAINGGSLTISGGKISNNNATGAAGGVLVNPNSTGTMTGGIISGNTAELNCGGLYVTQSSFTMSGGTIGGTTADDANSGQRGGGVFVYENATFTMTGGTITGNNATSGAGNGGGVYVFTGATFTMSNGTISGNTAAMYGGGVYVYTGTFNMENGTISGNESISQGGGIYGSTDATITINDGTIGGDTEEEANKSPRGGGIYVITKSTVIMTGGTITGNIATAFGGGFYVNNSTFTMSAGEVSNNTAPGGGGVLANGGATVIMEDGTITGNEANNGFGGGVNIDRATFTMEGGTISDNHVTYTDGSGGGMSVSNSGVVTLNGGTISDNTSDNCSGAIHVTGNSVITINDGTISHNTATNNGGGIGVYTSTLNVKGGEFYHNASTAGRGGAIYSASSNITLTDGTIGGDTDDDANTAGVNGGGVYCGSSVFTMEGGYIKGNKATANGAGLCANTCTIIIEGGEISNNLGNIASGVLAEACTTTMSGGKISNNTGTGNCAGILVTTSGTFIMNGGEISGNTTTGNGGGVHCGSNCTFTMNGGTISGNTANQGGGVYSLSNFVINGGKISANKTVGDGGGIYGAGGSLTINDGVIGGDTYATVNANDKIISGEGNIAGRYGGGMIYGNNTVITINGGKISHNESRAVIAGGGIHANGVIYMTGGEISYNRGLTNSAGGGGIALSSGELYMTGGEISNNEANYGGGIFVYSNSYLEISGGKIINNKAIRSESLPSDSKPCGGAIHLNVNNPRMLMTGGEISGNEAYTGGAINFEKGTVTMTGGIISNNTATYQSGAIHTGANTTFTMTGGEISGNQAYQWGSVSAAGADSVMNLSGGIITGNKLTRATGTYGAIDGYPNSILNVSGSIQIVDNYSGTSTATPLRADVCMDDSYINVVGKLTTAYIGMRSVFPATTLLTTGYGKYNGTTAPSTYFYSDDAAKKVELKDGEVVLSAGTSTVTSITLTWKWSTTNTDAGPWTAFTETNVSQVYDGKTYYVRAYNGTTNVAITNISHTAPDGSRLSVIKNVGTYQFSVNSSANKVYKNASLTLNITPAEVSVSWSETQLYYSGSMQYPSATLSGVIGTDSCSLILSTANAGTNAGNSYSVAVTGLSGAMAYNYKIASGNLTKNYSILPRELGVGGLSINDKVYDGTTAATLNSSTITLSGICNSDDVTVTVPAFGELNFDGANAGLHFVEFDLASLKLGGAAAKNYVLPEGTVKVYAYISPATVKIDGITLSGTKTYDGTYTATLNVANAKIYAYVDGAYSATALDISELDLVISAAGSFTDVNAGTGKTVNITSLSLSGADSVNFIIAVADSQATIENLTIAQAKVTVTVTAPSDWTYGDAKQISYTVGGAVSGETVDVTLTYKKGTDELTGAPVAAGNYSVTAALTNADGNYVIDTANSTLTVNYTIDAKAITLTANDATAEYGATPAGNGYAITSGALLDGDTLDGTAAYKFGTVSGTTFTEATAFAVGGAYKVQLSGLSNDNYKITFNYGTLSITKKSITVTLTVDGAAEYGKTYTAPDALVKAAFGTGDILAADSANVSVKLTYYKGTEALTGEPVNAGDYRVVATLQGTAAGNYKIAETAKNFTIAKRALTITAVSDELEYGEELPADGFGLTYGAGQLLEADMEANHVDPKAGVLTYKNGTGPVYNYDYSRYGNIGNGSFEITVSGITSDNYDIEFVAGTLTVKAKDVTVQIANSSSVYGDVIAIDSTLGTGYKFVKDAATVTSGVLARDTDDLGVVITTNATKTSGVGDDYNLIAEWTNKNYNVTFVGVSANNTATTTDGKTTIANAFEITPAALTIKVNDGSVPKGQALADSDFSVDNLTVKGLKNDETAETLLDGKLTFAVTTNSEGNYVVTVTVADLDNYTHTEQSGTWTVSAVLVTVVVSDGTSVYGDTVLTVADFTATVTDSYDKTLSLDDIGYELKIVLPDGVTSIKNARDYVVTAVEKSGNTISGYKVKVVNGKYTITPKAITVKAKNQTITFGADPANIYASIDATSAADLAKYIEATGFVTGDSYTALGTPALTVGGYLINGNAATYTGALVLTGFTGGSGNYKVTVQNGDLTVTKRSVKVLVDDSSLTSVYGEKINITYKTYLTATTVTSGLAEDGEVAGYALGLKLTLGAPTTTLADGVVVGTYAIEVDGLYSSNYEISNLTAVLAKTYSITAKAITVTTNDVTCDYDETPEGNGYKAEGLVEGDRLTEGTNFAYKFYNTSSVAITTGFKANGTYTVKVEGLENANYTITYVAGTLTVNGVKVTATVTVQANLTYGYTGDIATATLTGVASGDSVTAKLTYYEKDGGELSDAPVDAGTYSVVVTLDGADKDNYTIVENSKSFTIAKQEITVKAVAQTLVYGDDPTKIYDGADFTSETELAKYIALEGCTLAGSDDLTVLGTPAFIVSGYSRYGNVATYTGAIVLNGLSSANYDITFVNGDLTVTAREVKIALTTEDQKTLSSVYGKTFADISYTVYEKDGTTEWTSGADLGVVIDVTDYSTQAGTYAITVNKDNLNANYTLNQDSVDVVEAFKYTIAKAEITVKPNDIHVTAGTEVSGDATNITLTKGSLYDSLTDIFAEDGSLTFTFEGYNAADKKTGTFNIAIAVDNTKITNYTVTVATDSESNPVKAKLYVAGASTIFLSIDDASVLTSVYGNALKTSAQLVAKVKTSSPDVKVADLELVLEIVAEDGSAVKNVGDYKVQIKSHKADLDYTLVMTETPYKITARPITLKVVNAQLTYGDAASDLYKDVDFTDPALNLSTYIGLASGSTLATGDTFNVATFGTPTLKVSGYKQYDNIGTYDQAIVINGLSNDNYAITYQYGSLKVNARSVKVVLDDTSLTSVYGDEVEIAYKVFLDGTSTTATPDGLVNGDDLGLNISLVSPVYSTTGNLVKGSYNITAGTEHNSNYDFSWVTALSSKHYVVTAKSVTITADDATVTYGEDLYTGATYGYTTEGFVDGEDETVFTGSLVFKAGSVTLTGSTLLNASATAYTVTPSGYGASQGNYSITYVAGKLTVAPKKVAVTVKTDGEKTYDGAKITLPADYYDYDDTLLVEGDELGITLEVQSNGANCGMYVVKVKEATNTNYEVVSTPGYYKITEQKVYVQWLGKDDSATDFSWTYNVSPTSEATKQGPTAKFYKDAAFTQELTFVDESGETIEVTVNGLQVNVGSGYVASVQLPDSVNYVFASGTVHTKEFSITEAQLTVEWKKSAGTAVVADGVAIEYTYSGAMFVPVPVIKLGGVDVTENIAYTLSGKSQDVGAHTATLEVGLNYVIMVDGEPSHSAQRAFTIVGTALKNFNWQLPSGVFITVDDVKNGVEQSFEYTGAALSPKADAVGATISYTYLYSADGTSYTGCGDPIKAGHYKVTAVVDEGYAIPAGFDVVYFEITKIKVDIVWSATTFTFADGTHQAPVATFKDKLNGNAEVELLVEYSQNGLVLTDSAAVAAGEHTGTINVGEYYATIKPLSEIGYENYEFKVARDVERKYKINADTISIQWGPLYDEAGDTVHETNGTYTLTYSETAQGLSWGARKDNYGTQNEQDNLYFTYTVEKDGEVYELNDMSEPADIIKDAGTYKVSLSLKSKSPSVLVSNYALDGAATTVIVKPATLKITLKVDTASAQDVTSVNYGDEIIVRAEYEGFVNGDDEDSLGLKTDGKYWWITTAYTTTANPGSTWTVELTKNTLTKSSFYDKLRNYDVEIVNCTFNVSNVDGFVSIQGWNSNVSYFIYDGEAHEPTATYWDATLKKAVSLELEVTDGPAVLPGTYHIKVTKPDGVSFSNGKGDDGDIFEFEVVKRVLVVEVASQTVDFGAVTSDNAANAVTRQFGVYDGYNVKLEPVAEDREGLNITVGCAFEYDKNNIAVPKDGGYTINCKWNSDDYSDRYEVIFVDENNTVICGTNLVKFVINPAKITVTSRGEELFDEEVTLNPSGVSVGLTVIGEDGQYENIVFGGSDDISDASILFEYRVYDLNNEQDVADITSESYKPSYTLSNIKITNAGSYAVRYKIQKPNHETLEGIWRVLVLKEDDAIIVLFQNEYKVEYGDGVPANFIDEIFGVNEDGEEYFTLKGAITDKDTFRDMVERAYVYNVDEYSKVGYYTIYFDLKEGIGTTTHNFEIMYREAGKAETNRNKYVIEQKEITVDWGIETDTYTYDELVHMPAPVLTGWLNGGRFSLANSADGQRYFYTDSNNERIVITVRLRGDFTSIGTNHRVSIEIDNLNYTLSEDYKEIKILSGAIAPVEPTDPANGIGLPAWAMWAIIAAAIVLLIIMIILIVALKKRKQLVEGDGDSDGFYDSAEGEDNEGFDGDIFGDIFNEE